MTKYGTSPWVDLFPKSRVPAFPRHRGPIATDIAIVGGGLTGCAAAYAFAAAGIRVALVEQGQIGRGSSGSSSGWISDDPGVGFGALERALGFDTVPERLRLRLKMLGFSVKTLRLHTHQPEFLGLSLPFHFEPFAL